jgi:hypothetical protein
LVSRPPTSRPRIRPRAIPAISTRSPRSAPAVHARPSSSPPDGGCVGRGRASQARSALGEHGPDRRSRGSDLLGRGGGWRGRRGRVAGRAGQLL